MYLNPTGQLGGAETSLLEILASIRQAEPSWVLRLLVASDGPLVRRASSLGVSTVVLPFPLLLSRVGESGAVAARAYWRFGGQLVLAAASASGYLAHLRSAVREFAAGRRAHQRPQDASAWGVGPARARR